MNFSDTITGPLNVTHRNINMKCLNIDMTRDRKNIMLPDNVEGCVQSTILYIYNKIK